MKILIVSDTHKKDRNFFRVIKESSPVDMVIHCGDIEGSEQMLMAAAHCPLEMVAGNNDFFSQLPTEREFTVGRYHIWVTHGHQYHVSMGNERLKYEAAQRGADIVMYGHTHRPTLDLEGSVAAINPGSLSYPRQEGRKPSYVIMELDDAGEAVFSLHYMEEE